VSLERSPAGLLPLPSGAAKAGGDCRNRWIAGRAVCELRHWRSSASVKARCFATKHCAFGAPLPAPQRGARMLCLALIGSFPFRQGSSIGVKSSHNWSIILLVGAYSAEQRDA
jgi:hypothetical protein